MTAFFLILGLVLGHAQEIDQDPARPAFGKSGQIFTIKIMPKTQKLEVRLVDEPMVLLSPERVTVTARVRNRLGPRALSLETKGNELRLPKPVSEGEVYEFSIHDRASKKSETIFVESPPKR